MTAPVTALYASLIGLLLLALSYQVVRGRQRFKVNLGPGDSKELERAIRTQANLVEYAPIALLLMLLLEVNGGAGWALHGFGALLVICRLAHAWGLSHSSGTSPGRYYGTAGTWLILLGLALSNLYLLI